MLLDRQRLTGERRLIDLQRMSNGLVTSSWVVITTLSRVYYRPSSTAYAQDASTGFLRLLLSLAL